MGTCRTASGTETARVAVCADAVDLAELDAYGGQIVIKMT